MSVPPLEEDRPGFRPIEWAEISADSIVVNSRSARVTDPWPSFGSFRESMSYDSAESPQFEDTGASAR